MLTRVCACLCSVIIVLFFGVFSGIHAQEKALVSDVCLGCICEASSGCNRTLTCDGDVCGLFRITKDYWSDSGKPVISGDNPDDEGAYGRCVFDAECASRSVQGYMTEYGTDCNGDGVVNCDDFAAIHLLGADDCKGDVDKKYATRYNTCRNNFPNPATL